MTDARVEHTATRLRNGKVLVAGGLLGCPPNPYPGNVGVLPQLGSAEVYDPATGTWAPRTFMQTGHSNHTATLRNDGMVLVAGGISEMVTTAFVADDGSIYAQCDEGLFTERGEAYDPGPTPPQPPIASFASACSGLTCSFDGSASSDSDGTITSYSWSFGDGTTGAGPTASRTYAAAGTYTVTLTITDNDGATGSQSMSVTVGQAHVGDLDGVRTNQQASWTASVTITAHDSSHRPSPTPQSTVPGVASAVPAGARRTAPASARYPSPRSPGGIRA
jgi:PKD repeat protein